FILAFIGRDTFRPPEYAGRVTLFSLRWDCTTRGTSGKETNKMFGPMVGRGFLEYMQREQKAGASRPRVFLKLDGDPEIELLNFSSRPRYQSSPGVGHASFVGVGRSGPFQLDDEISFTFNDYLAAGRLWDYDARGHLIKEAVFRFTGKWPFYRRAVVPNRRVS